jgi:hypothetical protein
MHRAHKKMEEMIKETERIGNRKPNMINGGEWKDNENDRRNDREYQQGIHYRNDKEKMHISISYGTHKQEGKRVDRKQTRNRIYREIKEKTLRINGG